MRYTSVGHIAPTDKDKAAHVQSILINVEAFASWMTKTYPNGGDKFITNPDNHSVTLEGRGSNKD